MIMGQKWGENKSSWVGKVAWSSYLAVLLPLAAEGRQGITQLNCFAQINKCSHVPNSTAEIKGWFWEREITGTGPAMGSRQVRDRH